MLRGVSDPLTPDFPSSPPLVLTPLVSRMNSLGHIIGYAMGAIDLVRLFGPRLGDSQFKQLTLIAALGILSTAGVTCWAVTERVLLSVRPDPRRSTGRFKIVRQIWSTLLTLPPRIRGICNAVFWSWIGWFPFIVYSSTWVGEMYFRHDVPPEARNSHDALGEMGRIGSTALTVYSVMSFLSAWILPALIRSPEDEMPPAYTPRPPTSLAPYIEAFNKVKPDLLTAWIASCVLFAGAMFLTPFATSFRLATAIVALCGIPWSISQWAPVTFLGVEVNKMSSSSPFTQPPSSPPYHPRRRDSNDGTTASSENSIELLRLEHGPATATNSSAASSGLLEAGALDHGGSSSSTGELSGIYFGILNIYVTIPQFLSTLISGIVFAVLEPGKSPELAGHGHGAAMDDTTHGPGPSKGPNAIAVCLLLGAISSLVAAWTTRKLRRL